MKAPADFTRVVHCKRYSTKAATLIADDAFWDGHNFERNGRNTFLYRTPGGEYFEVTLTRWEGERDSLVPLDQDDAVSLYESLDDEDAMDFAEAFPGVTVKDA